MAVSIIVPIYNESYELLKALNSQLNDLKGEFEVIFIDSSDTPTLDTNFKVIRSAKGRGAQLNLGASKAKFEILWFLHADSKISPNFVYDIQNAIKTAKIGCFRLKFDSQNFILKLIALGSNLRVKWRNIAFGDQGIFITKELFNKLGGFKQIAIMEDYEFSMRVKRQGVKFHLLDKTIITSARKFKNPLKTLLKMQILQFRFRKNYDIKKIEDEYQKI
ncbi:TIGR04283 family arsenosugar biosynthesis glycosyltransferase [Campylobacter mucosalis]|uniref:Glycosyltransferase, family 2 n=1 Tax=Campylobacter mucosalis CCUG 21559 TaxID=1032067 RepID=A0A6G5QEN0_9BACT|nr:TIGR04283 family arsenosugar biosynthesis glycosyltransferase [Campylobacter mucosalis]QCD44049.1 glycosyltransferase, family 2 [Campylobacter mucosalis CCUG 21559]